MAAAVRIMFWRQLRQEEALSYRHQQRVPVEVWKAFAGTGALMESTLKRW
jgi:hypothetical protein